MVRQKDDFWGSRWMQERFPLQDNLNGHLSYELRSQLINWIDADMFFGPPTPQGRALVFTLKQQINAMDKEGTGW